MINFALFSALVAFYFTMFFTPGPNNAMLTASGMKFGFMRTLPHLVGISLGHIIQIGLTCFGLANIFLIYPWCKNTKWKLATQYKNTKASSYLIDCCEALFQLESSTELI